MSLGLKIQALRKEKNLSQKELATIIGVTTGIIAEWESDESEPNLAELTLLSNELDISIDNLLSVTTDCNITRATTTKQEFESVVTPAKKRKRTRLIIGLAAFCALLIIVGCILWIIGILNLKPLLFLRTQQKSKPLMHL